MVKIKLVCYLCLYCRTLEDLFHIPENTICLIVSQAADAIWEKLSLIYMKCPSTEEEWQKISNDFFEKWTLSTLYWCHRREAIKESLARNTALVSSVQEALHCALCTVQAFANLGTLFRNYKGTFSLVLFAICNANYKFTYTHIGSAGSANDAAIWNCSTFKSHLDAGQLGIPQTPGKVNFYLVGDDIFGLSKTVMKPFPRSNLNAKELVFNYRLSRARRVWENSFGILCNRFPILLTKYSTYLRP